MNAMNEFYYKSRKVKHLFIRNNSNKPDQPFNVVYQYTVKPR